MHSSASGLFTNLRPQLSARAVTIFGIATAVTFSACSGAPTPLYRLYQEGFGLSPLMLTVVFAAYAFSLLLALLTVGSLSDYVGRRPVIFAALALNAAAMAMFIAAGSATTLVAARIVQGFATGAATTTLGAAILDADRARGPLYNSITAFIGLTLGVLGSGALVTFAPAPMQLVYILLFSASVIEALILWGIPETKETRPGALASLKPHVRVPAPARQTLVRLTPINIAAWALGGFYFSLMPSLVRTATGLVSPFGGGVVVATLPFAALLAVAAFRAYAAERVVIAGTLLLTLGVSVTLMGVGLEYASLLIAGAAAAGIGFGLVFSGTVRSVLPLAPAAERAGLLAIFYVESYLAFSLPAILVGLFAPVWGLELATYIYGAAIIALAVVSLGSEVRRLNNRSRMG